MTHFRNVLAGAVVLTGMSIAAPLEASPITLVDRNSTVTIDVDSSAGMNSWVVDGVNHLFQQWFWYRIHTVDGNNVEIGDEAPINALGTAVVLGPYNGDFDPGNDQVAIRHSSGQLEVTVQYTLQGQNPGTNHSIIGEEITIENLTASTMLVHFYQDSDFDLGGTMNDDTVTLSGMAASQHDGGGPYISEVVGFGVNSTPSRYEANTYANTLAAFSDGLPTNLNNNSSAGPGDVTWAFQWDLSIAPGASVGFSKQKSVGVPEPASLVLFGIGLMGAAGAARRRKVELPRA